MARIEIRLPDLGLANQPISLSNWFVSRGSRVEQGEPLAEILAGPATIDLPSPAAGVLAKRLVDVDEPLSVGQVLAVIETDAVS
jgi:2-oxoglutarate dehydrogenase E2 component (dihydrolipoamide succinyltransferase)